MLFRITKKIILGIDLSVRKGRGVLNTPHMYLNFWSYVSFWGRLEGAYAIRLYRDTEYVIFHNHFSDQKKGHAISHNPSSIQIKGRYILHDHFLDQKKRP